MSIKAELLNQFDAELEESDTIALEHNYCDNMIVDIIVTDGITKAKHPFYAFNLRYGKFPY